MNIDPKDLADALLSKPRPQVLWHDEETIKTKVINRKEHKIEFMGTRLIVDDRIIRTTKRIITIRELGEYEAQIADFMEGTK